MLVISLLLLSLTNILAFLEDRSCDPRQNPSGRCICYKCLNHVPFNAYDGKLNWSEEGMHPIGSSCPDAKIRGRRWKHIRQ